MRDTKMASTFLGLSLIDIYYRNADEISEVLRADEVLTKMVSEVVQNIVEKALAINNNEAVSIDQALVNRILGIADEVGVKGSPELKSAIEIEKKEIKTGAVFKQMGIAVK
jgi:hypothetical protein